MGLFSSVLHLRDRSRETLLPALDALLRGAGFSRAETLPVTAEGPYAIPNHEAAVSSGLYYLVSSRHGDWLTVLEAHFAVHGAPQLSDLGSQLSAVLSCNAITLVVHDDDLFLYNLDRDGSSLDGYNSCPDYFESKRLPDCAD